MSTEINFFCILTSFKKFQLDNKLDNTDKYDKKQPYITNLNI